MEGYLYFLFLIISFLASVAGAICGIGGGVLIKPLLDAFGVLSVASISFLSGCTVLSMACYSVVKSKQRQEPGMYQRNGTILAVGAAVGGAAGKLMFQRISSAFADANQIGAVQAGCLMIITASTLAYTVKKEKIRTLHITNKTACMAIGILLGICSSFLGIGGGPINLVVLFYFFSMETKEAAAASLYIIMFSQSTALLNTVLSGNIPQFDWFLLVLMVCGGLTGGAIGRKINEKIEEKTVNRMFIGLMFLIILINIYNIYRFI